jgi:voltage-gated potassium channel
MTRTWTKWTDKPFALPLALMGVILVGAAVGFKYFESHTQQEPVGLFEGLWWAMVTLFTVGYGDFVPKTVPGRVLGMVVMASGIGLVSAITGALASAMMERKLKKRRGLLPVSAYEHVLLMGWNGHGAILVERLRRMPEYAKAPVVLAADLEPSVYEEISETLGLGSELSFVRGDISHKSVLERANPERARLAYILAREDVPPEEADNLSVLTALTLRALAPRVLLYAESLRDQSREHLLRAGVTKVMNREELAGNVLAFMAGHPVMHDVLRALLAGAENGAMRFRPLGEAEKKLGWRELVRQNLERTGQLTLAACRLPRELNLGDLLDASQALDGFIMELFQSAGRDTTLASQGPRVVLNPAEGQDLSGFDGVIYLDRAS